MRNPIAIIPRYEFERVAAARIEPNPRLAIIADMCRLIALSCVKLAGSGHLGSSLSSLDIVTYLYHSEMNLSRLGVQHPDRDVYISSKGHDAPGLYAVLFSLGIVPLEQLIRLRRIDGLCGHPDVRTSGIEANTGSLGMGISKGKGILLGKRLLSRGGRVFVMTGDGEFQEGQIFEALQSAAHQRLGHLHVVIDHNKVQSDRLVRDVVDLGDLEAKLRAFGWYVARCDGHDYAALGRAFAEFRRVGTQPKVLIADTIKGRGVSFMEHPRALAQSDGVYRWHAGAPDDESFERAHAELLGSINDRLGSGGLSPITLEPVPRDQSAVEASGDHVADSFGSALVRLAEEHPEIVVLDADLAADCRLRAFEAAHPERFVEHGIAEQDMVSTAGGLALHGLLPVVNSFAAFLTARGNEQIYNNSTEGARILYVLHYGGLIPAAPGHSHQSVRDISLLAALPHMVIIEPCNAAEAEMALEYCVREARESCALRLFMGPSPRPIPLPTGYRLREGRGALLVEGDRNLLFAYGPLMLDQALRAAELLRAEGLALSVVNMPWLNRVDPDWLRELVEPTSRMYVLEDHAAVGGLGDCLLRALTSNGLLEGRRIRILGVEGHPAWGRPDEVLRHHRLDAEAIAQRIAEDALSPLGGGATIEIPETLLGSSTAARPMRKR